MSKDATFELVALEIQIEALEVQLEHLRKKRREIAGEPRRIDIRTREYSGMSPSLAFQKVIEKHGHPMRPEDVAIEIIEGGNEFGDLSGPMSHITRVVSAAIRTKKYFRRLEDGRLWLLDEPIPEDSE